MPAQEASAETSPDDRVWHARAAVARWWVAALTLGSLALAGCQYNIEVGAINRCDVPVEVDIAASKRPAESRPAGEALETGEHAYVRSVPESEEAVYVLVQGPSSPQVVTHRVAVDDLTDPSDQANYEKEVVLSGALCPS